LVAPQELPVGVLTAVLGGYLLWLMPTHRTRGWPVMNEGRYRRAAGASLRAAWATPVLPRHLTDVARRALDQRRRAQRRPSKSTLPLGCWPGCIAPAACDAAGPVRSVAGQTAIAQQLSWLGQDEASTDETLTAYDVTMLGRLPHQAWLAASIG
jgi:hypothetical protein